jgi:hypothetical protein
MVKAEVDSSGKVTLGVRSESRGGGRRWCY